MYTIEEIKEDVIELLKINDIIKFEKYIKYNDIALKDLNDKDFDILIYSIENDASFEIIKFIISQCQYETLNYFVVENGIFKLPLFYAIIKNNFRVANLLIEKKADINFTLNKTSIVYYLFKLNYLTNKNLKYILSKGFNINFITYNIVDEFIQTQQNGFLKIISDHIFNSLVLNLLRIYNNKDALTSQQLLQVLANDKKKIIVDDCLYKNAIDVNNSEAIKILFSHDISDQDIIFRRINKYEILEKAIKLNDYYFVKNLLCYDTFNFKNINSRRIFMEANRYNNMKVMKLLIQKSLDAYSDNEVCNNLKSENTAEQPKKYNVYYLNLILNSAIELLNMNLVKFIVEGDEFKDYTDINAPDVNGNYPLISAFYTKNVDMFRYLLERGADYNIKNINGIPLLSLAIDNNPYIIKYLLKHKININEKDASGTYPLIKAINKNNIDTVILLVEYGITNNIDMNIIDMNGNTPITLAYKLNNPSIFRFLLKYLDINKKDLKGNTILYYAIFNNDIETVKELISIGADINFKDKFGNSAIQIAIFKKNQNVLKILFSNSNLLLNIPNFRGETPIFTIINICNYSVIEKIIIIDNLIKRGADINFEDNEGNTPLIYAIQNGSLPIIELLVENGANVNYVIKSKNKSVLTYAIELGELDIVKHLVKCGADVNFKNKNGVSILGEAINNLKWEIFKFLVNNNVNNCMSGDFYEKEIIEKVISNNRLDILKFLVTNNLNINIKDKDGNTPLSYAIKAKNSDIVKYLIEIGANVNNKNNKGESYDDVNLAYNSFMNKGYQYYTDVGIKIKDLKKNAHRIRHGCC